MEKFYNVCKPLQNALMIILSKGGFDFSDVIIKETQQIVTICSTTKNVVVTLFNNKEDIKIRFCIFLESTQNLEKFVDIKCYKQFGNFEDHNYQFDITYETKLIDETSIKLLNIIKTL